jgi:Zn-dependent protease
MKGFRICRIFGIDIELHWTWFLIFVYFSWMIADQILPHFVPGQSALAYWAFGITMVLLLFVSVLVHELAHSKVAQLFKISVERITLTFFGGLAQIGNELSKSAKVEFWIAIAGPLSSLGMAGIFWALAKFLKTDMMLVAVSLSYLFVMNLILAIFNLLPAYPMDGGRVFKQFYGQSPKMKCCH